MKILHFADLHIGVTIYGHIDSLTGLNSTVLSYLKLLGDIVDYAIDNAIDLVVFAGDAFHTKKPHPTHQQLFVECILRLSKAGIPTILLPGNHDMPSATGTYPALNILSVAEVPNVFVPLDVELIIIETSSGVCQIGCAPHPQWQRLMELDEMRSQPKEALESIANELLLADIQALAENVSPANPAILVAHLTVDASLRGAERDMMQGHEFTMSAHDLADMGWDYVALGHIHKYQDLNPDGVPVVYSGSVGRVNIGEASEPKGFCVIDIDADGLDYEFIHLDATPMTVVKVDGRDLDIADGVFGIANILGDADVTGHIVKASIHLGRGVDSGNVRKAYKAALRDAYNLTLDIQAARETRQRLPTSSNVTSMSDMELLALYLETKGKRVKPKVHREVLSLAKEIMSDGTV